MSTARYVRGHSHKRKDVAMFYKTEVKDAEVVAALNVIDEIGKQGGPAIQETVARAIEEMFLKGVRTGFGHTGEKGDKKVTGVVERILHDLRDYR